MSGVITKVVENQGWGFIEADDQQTYFLHVSALPVDLSIQSLTVGDRVTFIGLETPRGLRAGRVELEAR